MAPEKFQWFIKEGTFTGMKPQMWAPFVVPKEFYDRKNVGRFLTVVARLKPGATRFTGAIADGHSRRANRTRSIPTSTATGVPP